MDPKSPYPTADEAKKQKAEHLEVEVAKWELSIGEAISKWILDPRNPEGTCIGIPDYIPKETVIKHVKLLKDGSYNVRVTSGSSEQPVYFPEIDQVYKTTQNTVPRFWALRIRVQKEKAKEEDASPCCLHLEWKTLADFLLKCNLGVLLLLWILFGLMIPQVTANVIFVVMFAYRFLVEPKKNKTTR